MPTLDDEDVVVSKRKAPKLPTRKSRAEEWYSEHDWTDDVFDYVRDGYNNVVGVRVDGGVYR